MSAMARRCDGSMIAPCADRFSSRLSRYNTAHLRDVPADVTIIRPRYAFEGQTLSVIHAIKRCGVLSSGRANTCACRNLRRESSMLMNEPPPNGREGPAREGELKLLSSEETVLSESRSAEALF
jgi:hypothetical protein